MAAIGMMSVRDETEERDHRPFQQIGSLDRQVQGRIIQRSLRTLHPIDNALPLGIEDSSISQRHPGLSQSASIESTKQSPSFSPMVCFSYWASLGFSWQASAIRLNIFANTNRWRG